MKSWYNPLSLMICIFFPPWLCFFCRLHSSSDMRSWWIQSCYKVIRMLSSHDNCQIRRKSSYFLNTLCTFHLMNIYVNVSALSVVHWEQFFAVQSRNAYIMSKETGQPFKCYIPSLMHSLKDYHIFNLLNDFHVILLLGKKRGTHNVTNW